MRPLSGGTQVPCARNSHAVVSGSKAYDRIVIEMSGVAEPKNVRREFVEAAGNRPPTLAPR
jgi:G3E family GTPase